MVKTCLNVKLQAELIKIEYSKRRLQFKHEVERQIFNKYLTSGKKEMWLHGTGY